MTQPDYICTNGSLDCCTKQEIENNKKHHRTCDICHNSGYLEPKMTQPDDEYKQNKSNDMYNGIILILLGIILTLFAYYMLVK